MDRASNFADRKVEPHRGKRATETIKANSRWKTRKIQSKSTRNKHANKALGNVVKQFATRLRLGEGEGGRKPS